MKKLKIVISNVLICTLLFLSCFTAFANEKDTNLLGGGADLNWIENSDSNLRYAESPSYSSTITSYAIQGKVGDVWVRTTCGDQAYTAATSPVNTDIDITIEPSFRSNFINFEYTVTNNGAANATFTFWVGADTMIGVTDYSDNKANSTHTKLSMAGKKSYESTENDAVFSITSRDNGFYVKSIYYGDLYDLMSEGKTPAEIEELTTQGDSGFLAYWPSITLAPGETIIYSTYSAVGDAKFVPVKGITSDCDDMLNANGSLKTTYEVGDYFDVGAIVATPSTATNIDITWDSTTFPPVDGSSCLNRAGTYTLKGIIPWGKAEDGEDTDYIIEYTFKVNRNDDPIINDVDYVDEKPIKTGTWGDPVTDGIWSIDSSGNWSYKTNAYFKNTWGYILNPYAKTEKDKYGWFWFDANGKMLIGWQKLNNKWYYLNATSDGTLGMCYLDTTTPDGYKVDKNGVWIEE